MKLILLLFLYLTLSIANTFGQCILEKINFPSNCIDENIIHGQIKEVENSNIFLDAVYVTEEENLKWNRLKVDSNGYYILITKEFTEKDTSVSYKSGRLISKGIVKESLVLSVSGNYWVDGCGMTDLTDRALIINSKGNIFKVYACSGGMWEALQKDEKFKNNYHILESLVELAEKP